MNKQLLIMLILCIGQHIFALDLEGKSGYVIDEELAKIESKLTIDYIADLENFEIGDKQCEYQILEDLYQLDKDVSLDDALIILRSKDQIDDTTFRLLSRTLDSFTISKQSKLLAPIYKSSKGFEKAPFKEFRNSIDRGLCFNQAFKVLVAKLGESKNSKIIGKFKVAYRKELISKVEYWQLKKMVKSLYHREPKTLLEYKKVQDFLSRQFPQREDIEASDYISGRGHKSKVSRREYFLAKYNQFQIIHLSKMTERLLNRLNADEVIISVFIDGEVVEEILLDPLEQYRFAAKMVRKELGDLATTSLFSGVSVTYDDILAAAFETGLVPGETLSTLAMVEDIWNPELTKAEKTKMFVKRYGMIFAAAMPTSVYLLKVLALVGIETFTKTQKEPNRDHSIF